MKFRTYKWVLFNSTFYLFNFRNSVIANPHRFHYFSFSFSHSYITICHGSVSRERERERQFIWNGGSFLVMERTKLLTIFHLVERIIGDHIYFLMHSTVSYWVLYILMQSTLENIIKRDSAFQTLQTFQRVPLIISIYPFCYSYNIANHIQSLVNQDSCNLSSTIFIR